jgi:acetyl-CoA carboxylase carboxyl transferase subunit beta
LFDNEFTPTFILPRQGGGTRGAQEGGAMSKPRKVDSIPEGLWQKCPQCAVLLYQKDLERDLKVCRRCGHHLRLSARERVEFTADEGSFVEMDANLRPANPLGFPEYEEKLARDEAKTELPDAYIWGECKVDGVPVAMGAADPGFLMGSMGCVVGEKVARTMEHAAGKKMPVIVFSASGGARMQEGILSLMQMAKTAAAAERLNAASRPYISVLTDPTTAGVLASFASLGDLIIAEPGALIGFAGRRVIEQGLKVRVDPKSQTAEFHLEHGLIDMIVPRREMRSTLAWFLKHLA